MKRTTGRSDTASRCTGNRGLRAHVSRSASDVGGEANSVDASSTIHSAPASARMRASVERATEPSKYAGWRTSTATRCSAAPSVGRRRTNVASAPRSCGPNDAGSWTEICSARCPSGAIRSKNWRVSSSALRSRRSWVIVRGSLKRKRNSSGAWAAQDATVVADGRP
jgi:hypothetical protein